MFRKRDEGRFRESFSNALPDKEIPNKTTILRMFTKCLGKEIVINIRRAIKQLKLRPY